MLSCMSYPYPFSPWLREMEKEKEKESSLIPITHISNRANEEPHPKIPFEHSPHHYSILDDIWRNQSEHQRDMSIIPAESTSTDDIPHHRIISNIIISIEYPVYLTSLFVPNAHWNIFLYKKVYIQYSRLQRKRKVPSSLSMKHHIYCFHDIYSVYRHLNFHWNQSGFFAAQYPIHALNQQMSHAMSSTRHNFHNFNNLIAQSLTLSYTLLALTHPCRAFTQTSSSLFSTHI